MKHSFLVLIALFATASALHAQGSDAPGTTTEISIATPDPLRMMMLVTKDLPEGYRFSDTTYIKSIQAVTFYKNPSLYAALIGEVEDKSFQSFVGENGDKGTILYFTFKGPITGEGFIQGLIWGGDEPTAKHPEQIIVKGDRMVIISFARGSDMGEKAREIIEKRL